MTPTCAASQTVPSCDSPSPINVNTLFIFFLILCPSATPIEKDNPCPKLPVEASTPATLVTSGCPPRILPSFEYEFSSISDINPYLFNTTNKARITSYNVCYTKLLRQDDL